MMISWGRCHCHRIVQAVETKTEIFTSLATPIAITSLPSCGTEFMHCQCVTDLRHRMTDYMLGVNRSTDRPAMRL